MDKTVPPGAGLLLDFIAGFEAPKGYATVYANRMAKMPVTLTSMSLAEVIAQGPWRTKTFGSSACGRYQFMTATLQDLRKTLVLMGDDLFTPDFQDRLAYALLKRRGYAKFMAGTLSQTAFGLAIAQEWASFPVLVACKGASRQLARGQSYYAGDGLNKALVKPEAVETALAQVLATGLVVAAVTKPPDPPAAPKPIIAPTQPALTGELSSAPAQAPLGPIVQTGGFWAALKSLFTKKAA